MAAPQPATPPTRHRSWPLVVSLAASVIILAAKLVGWWITGSAAVLSDALESTVNVVAAAFALMAVRVGSLPADENHPYGHGKVEFLSAGFEGGLVFLAAVMIVTSGVMAVYRGHAPHTLNVGLLITAGGGGANLLLGWWLVKEGRRLDSMAVVADGKHVLSDVWTTLGVLAGLGAVWLTGIAALDGITAILVGALLAFHAVKVMRDAVGGLMDQEDPQLIARVRRAFDAVKPEGVKELHRVRAIRSGAVVHVDAHVKVPAEWTVVQAHEVMVALERRMKEQCGIQGDIALHLDPG